MPRLEHLFYFDKSPGSIDMVSARTLPDSPTTTTNRFPPTTSPDPSCRGGGGGGGGGGVWQLAGHVAGSRAYWFHDVLGEGDPATRDLFRVDRTTVPDLPLENAGWEDDEDHPRSAEELVDGLRRTWTIVDDCLRRWTADDLDGSVVRPSRTHHRGWVVWHVMEHDLHHGGEISQILGSNRLAGPDL